MDSIEIRKIIARGGKSTLYMEGNSFKVKVRTIDTEYAHRADPIHRTINGGVTTVITAEILEDINGCESPFRIKKVIFNNPATIVLWEDGTKTVVKTQEGDIYDPEKGLAMAISKKALGNKYDYYNTFKHWTKKYKEV